MIKRELSLQLFQKKAHIRNPANACQEDAGIGILSVYDKRVATSDIPAHGGFLTLKTYKSHLGLLNAFRDWAPSCNECGLLVTEQVRTEGYRLDVVINANRTGGSLSIYNYNEGWRIKQCVPYKTDKALLDRILYEALNGWERLNLTLDKA